MLDAPDVEVWHLLQPNCPNFLPLSLKINFFNFVLETDSSVFVCFEIFCSIRYNNLCSILAADGSVARGGRGGYNPPHWHVDQNAEWEKHYVFSTFEAVLCTEVD